MEKFGGTVASSHNKGPKETWDKKNSYQHNKGRVSCNYSSYYTKIWNKQRSLVFPFLFNVVFEVWLEHQDKRKK